MSKRSHFSMRVDEHKLLEFKIAAEIKGSSMSGLIHQFMARTIREAKTQSPQEFEAMISSEKDSNNELIIPSNWPLHDAIFTETESAEDSEERKKRTG